MIVRLEPQNFELYAGNAKTLHFEIVDEDGAVVDITGATIAWGVSTHENSKSKLFSYTSPTNITITDAANGKFDVSVLASNTAALKAGDYHHQAEVTDAGGNPTTVAFGTIELRTNIH